MLPGKLTIGKMNVWNPSCVHSNVRGVRGWIDVDSQNSLSGKFKRPKPYQVSLLALMPYISGYTASSSSPVLISRVFKKDCRLQTRCWDYVGPKSRHLRLERAAVGLIKGKNAFHK
eukprot:1393912-Amorphochlora_amoeboformis.AAC.1